MATELLANCSLHWESDNTDCLERTCVRHVSVTEKENERNKSSEKGRNCDDICRSIYN